MDYLLNVTAYTEDFVGREVNRYATWPGQACSYTIGKLKINELRRKAENQLCKRFSVLILSILLNDKGFDVVVFSFFLVLFCPAV